MWDRRGSALSDKDILKLMGEEVFIHPFNKNNLKGSSYNLTASIIAYKIDKIKVKDKDDKEYTIDVKKLLINENKEIVIEPGITALIQTNESIYVSNKICGTYHSKVGLCEKGLSHIGTTLDPCYLGTSLIAVHNNSNETIKIKEGDTFASLMLYTLRHKSETHHNNLPFRADLEDLKIDYFDKEYLNKEECKGETCPYYQGCKGTGMCNNKIEDKYIEVKKEILEKIHIWVNEEWRSNLEELKRVVREEKLKRNQHRYMRNIETLVSVAQIAITTVLIAYLLFANLDINSAKYKISVAVTGIMPALVKCIEKTIKNLYRGE